MLPIGLASGHAAAAVSDASAVIDWLSPVPLAWVYPKTFNWSESPVRLNFHDYAGFNDNILGVYPGFALPSNTLKGDWFNRMDVGASTRFYAGAQQIFADATYTTVDYRRDAAYDTHNYMFDAGINWQATARCQGNVTGTLGQAQSPIDQLLAPGIDIARTVSVNETGSCTVYDNSGFVINSGWSKIEHAAQIYQVNNSQSAYIQGGLKYNLSGPDNAQFLVRYTETTYPDRYASLGLHPALLPYGLLQTNHQVDYQVVYDRTVSQKLDFQTSAGLTWNSGLFGTGNTASEQRLLPSYSLGVNWRPTEKWSVNVTAGHTAGVATSIIANAQVTDIQSASVTYAWSPKLSLQGSLSRAETSGAANLVANSSYYGPGTSFRATARATYQITPFTSASASYQRSDRTINGYTVMNNVAMIGLDYKPY